MPATSPCHGFDEVAAELALGIATGEQRAAALAHAAGCERCSERLRELSEAVDGLLLLAPEQEPSLGFESELQERIDSSRRPRPSRRRLPRLRIALPALLAGAAIVLLGTSWIAGRDDRRLAADYRQALGEVNGNYFTTFALLGPGSRRVGSGFAYEGDPSWVFVTLDAPAGAIPSGRYQLGVTLGDGSTPPAVPIAVHSGRGSGGLSFAGDLDDLDGLRFRGADGAIELSTDSPRAIYP